MKDFIKGMAAFLLLGGLFLFLAFCAYTLFVWAPVHLYTEAQCLAQGYPKARLSVGLERYCTTLDGAVTVRAVKP